jgi:type II secretion system (T2SS) protein E
MKNKAMHPTFVSDISKILVQQGAISEVDAQAMQNSFAIQATDQFEEFMLDQGLIEKGVILRALGEYYKVPPLDVGGIFFDHLLLTNFPKDFLLRNEIIPWQIDNDELVMVAAKPTTPGLASAIEKFTNNDVVFVVGLARDIIDAVEDFYDKSPTEASQDNDIDPEQELEQEAHEYEEHEDDIFRG